jgi:hypothetical protein
MKRGVDSETWGEGGVFHDGIGGRSAAECAAAARGKLSTIGGLVVVGDFRYFGWYGAGEFSGGGKPSGRAWMMGIDMLDMPERR